MAAFTETAVRVERVTELGMDPGQLQKMKDVVLQDIERGLYDGAVMAIARHGEIVINEAVGLANLESKRPASIDDLFFIMSITKQFTAVRTMMDVEAGKYCLTTPVREIIPEFGIKGKQRVTIAQMLSHTSGLNTEVPYGLPPENLLDIEAVTAAICNERLHYTPGTMVSYNALVAHSVLAAITTRLDETKRGYRQILKEDLFDPLGMTNTALGLPEAHKHRIVPLVVRDKTPGMFDPILIESVNFLITETAEFPAGGAVSTAMDIVRFGEMLRNKGELNGNRVLSPESVAIATANHTGELPNHLMDYMREMYGWSGFPANMGLSFFLRGEGYFPTFLGLSTSPGTFGGMGAGSTAFWVDPERGLTYAFMSAGLMEEGASILRHQRLSDMAVAAVTG